MLEPGRTLVLRDRGRMVAGASVFSRRLTIPGGVTPLAAVTLVGVRPDRHGKQPLRAAVTDGAYAMIARFTRTARPATSTSARWSPPPPTAGPR